MQFHTSSFCAEKLRFLPYEHEEKGEENTTLGKLESSVGRRKVFSLFGSTAGGGKLNVWQQLVLYRAGAFFPWSELNFVSSLLWRLDNGPGKAFVLSGSTYWIFNYSRPAFKWCENSNSTARQKLVCLLSSRTFRRQKICSRFIYHSAFLAPSLVHESAVSHGTQNALLKFSYFMIIALLNSSGKDFLSVFSCPEAEPELSSFRKKIKICINYSIALRELLHTRAGDWKWWKTHFRMMLQSRPNDPIRLVHLNRKFAENLLHIKKQFKCQEMKWGKVFLFLLNFSCLSTSQGREFH